MAKSDKRRMVLSVAACFIPTLVGLCLLKRLPDELAVHFGFDGTPDSWWPTWVAILVLPAMLAGINLICLAATFGSSSRTNISPVVQRILFWLVPVMDNVVMATLYLIAMGQPVSVSMVCMFLIGILLVVLGNYMGKVKQNPFVGFRTGRTLSDPENWIRTNRVGGFGMVVSGIVMMAAGIINTNTAFIAAFGFMALATVIVPLMYSARIAKK